MSVFYFSPCARNTGLTLILTSAILAASIHTALAKPPSSLHHQTTTVHIAAVPAPVRIAPGREVDIPLNVTLHSGTTGTMLRATGLPQGLKVWFYPAHLTQTGNTLYVSASKDARPCAFTCSIEALRQSHVIGSVPVTIRVLPAASVVAADTPYDFTAAAKVRTAAFLPTTGTLLNNIGELARPVSSPLAPQWRAALHAGRLDRKRAAQLQVWLGEYLLSHDKQPEQAAQHFRQAQRLLAKSDLLYGLAAYDSALTLYYAGAYSAAKDAFQTLLTQRPALHGFDRKTCVLWSRTAILCWGYHEQRSAMGIPEPPRLDPLCAAAALATCVRDLHGPYDKKTILRACRVTGEGSLMADVLAAADQKRSFLIDRREA